MSIQFLSHMDGKEANFSTVHVAAFPQGRGWNEKAFKDLLEISFHYLVVDYDDENKIRGFLLYSLILDEAEILTFCVSPAKQSKGVGGNLLAVFLEKMKNKHVTTVLLDVAENNFSAIKLYNRYGFMENGRRRKYYENKIDALLMSKAL